MKTYEKVKEATYKYAIELCKIFIEQGLEEWESDSIGVLDWEMLIRRVMSKIPDIEEMEYAFDESIWFPNSTRDYNNKVLFRIALKNYSNEHLPFYLYLDKRTNQEPKFLHP